MVVVVVVLISRPVRRCGHSECSADITVANRSVAHVARPFGAFLVEIIRTLFFLRFEEASFVIQNFACHLHVGSPMRFSPYEM